MITRFKSKGGIHFALVNILQNMHNLVRIKGLSDISCKQLWGNKIAVITTCCNFNESEVDTPFKSKGLKKLFEAGDATGIQPQHTQRLRKILALLETADKIEDMDLSGLNLHALKGNRKGTHAVKVSGNWRVTFKIIDGDVIDINYEDYH